tara:strand:- start:258 stop:575 length:318 start_codon:yes stop_codon:yes gene_type:complete
MKLITNEQDLVGKTIEKAMILDDTAFVLTLTDGSFSYIKAINFYDGVEMELSEEDDVDEFQLRAAGLITEQEYEAQMAARREKASARSLSRDLVLYEKLKARLGK